MCTFGKSWRHVDDFSLGGNWQDIVNYDMYYKINHDLT